MALAGVSGEALELGSLGSKFDVTLSLAETSGGGLEGSLEYDGDLFEASTMARLMAHVSEALRGLAAAPDRPVWRLGLVSAAERARLLGSVRGVAGIAGIAGIGCVAGRGPGCGAAGWGCGMGGWFGAELSGVVGAVWGAGVLGGCGDLGSGSIGRRDCVCRADLRRWWRRWRCGGRGAGMWRWIRVIRTVRLDYPNGDSGAGVVLCQGAAAAARLGGLAAASGVRVLDLDRDGGRDGGRDGETSGAAASGAALLGPAHGAGLAYVIYTSV